MQLLGNRQVSSEQQVMNSALAKRATLAGNTKAVP
jgi:hypothetical protein